MDLRQTTLNTLKLLNTLSVTVREAEEALRRLGQALDVSIDSVEKLIQIGEDQ